MSTVYHTPIVVGSNVESTGGGDGDVNARLSDLDTAISNITGILDANGNLVLDGLWDGEHIIMGGAHLWFHSGSFYFKTSAPSSATDGTTIP